MAVLAKESLQLLPCRLSEEVGQDLNSTTHTYTHTQHKHRHNLQTQRFANQKQIHVHFSEHFHVIIRIECYFIILFFGSFVCD